jgi:hypothetical protein
MSSNTTQAGAGEPSEFDLLRAVVVQHIVDGQMSGSAAAAALSQSLITEIDAAGLDITADVNAHYATLDQQSAGE